MNCSMSTDAKQRRQKRAWLPADYQAFDRTLNDKDALNIRNRIVKQTKNVFGAVLRSS